MNGQQRDQQQEAAAIIAAAAAAEALPDFDRPLVLAFLMEADHETLSIEKIYEKFVELKICRPATTAPDKKYVEDRRKEILESFDARKDQVALRQWKLAANRIRQRANDVVYKLTAEGFVRFSYPDDGFPYRTEKACAFLVEEYYRHELEAVRSRTNYMMADQSAARTVVNTQEIGFAGLFEASAYVGTTNGQARGVLPVALNAILIWCSGYDRRDMPLNPIAVSLLANKQIYVRHAFHRLPRVVSRIIESWIVHVGKIENARYSNVMAILSDPESTVDQVWNKCADQDEICCMAMALQHQLAKVAEHTNSEIASIPLPEFYDKLSNVDFIANRIKVFHFRDRTAASDMVSTAPELHKTGLYLRSCSDETNTPEVAEFFSSLKKKASSPPGLLPTPESTTSTGTTSSKHVKEKKKNQTQDRVCNFCGLRTSNHQGYNCPWRGKKGRSELGKMSKEEKLKFPA